MIRLKFFAGGLTGGLVLAATGGVEPDAMAMMYSLALAVIGLAGLAFQRSRKPVQVPALHPDLIARLEDLAYGIETTKQNTGTFRVELGARIDRVDTRIQDLTHEIGGFRESTVRLLADHGARIGGLEKAKAQP